MSGMISRRLTTYTWSSAASAVSPVGTIRRSPRAMPITRKGAEACTERRSRRRRFTSGACAPTFTPSSWTAVGKSATSAAVS
jgi:hypothetical protein